VYKNKIMVVVIFIGLFFITLRYYSVMGPSIIGTVSSCMMYPLLRTQHMVIEPITRWMNRRTEIHDLENMVAQLQKERDQYCSELIALKGMQQYINATDQLRTFNTRYALKDGYVVQIVARHFSPQNQFFLVDAGSSQGITKDMVALYGMQL
jgi:cell shape-determining protein MreC